MCFVAISLGDSWSLSESQYKASTLFQVNLSNRNKVGKQ